MPPPQVPAVLLPAAHRQDRIVELHRKSQVKALTNITHLSHCLRQAFARRSASLGRKSLEKKDFYSKTKAALPKPLLVG